MSDLSPPSGVKQISNFRGFTSAPDPERRLGVPRSRTAAKLMTQYALIRYVVRDILARGSECISVSGNGAS
jgi:hypothetical protein